MKKTHIFLTGERQVGKTTLLHHVLEDLGRTPSGFETRPYYIADRIKGYYMHSLVPCEENDIPISIRHRTDASMPILLAFDDFGALVLRNSRTDASDMILMDELGILEEQAEEFKREVFSCLNGEKQVIGVVKKADSPFLNQIRSREDCLVLELTVENRGEIYNKLRTMLQ